MVTVLLVLAVVCWVLGGLNVTVPVGNPVTRYAPNWISWGLAFAGAGLWLAPLVVK